MEFEMTVGLNEEYCAKLFKLRDKEGSNKSISEVIEECLREGIDRNLKEGE